MRSLFALVLLLAAVIVLLPSCNADEPMLRAKQIENRHELVGGPVAMADVGDFLLENDKIRVAILGAKDSPGPGVFGGSVVDIDLRRPATTPDSGQGHDRFAETFPVANLLVPEPTSLGVSVLHDGSDGKQAAIRVEGNGEFLFEALGILRNQKNLLDLLFPNVRTEIYFQTDYILKPGDQFITIQTKLFLGDVQPGGCADVQSCPEECPNGRAQNEEGCLVCECSDVLELPNFFEPKSVFGGILGDVPGEAESVIKAGVGAGDFVFFGNQNDVFAPGPGFDEDAAVQRANNIGQNSFQSPLTFEFVAAAGGDISYGYFTKANQGAEKALVNVPLFASAATAFFAAGINCALDPADDATCDRNRTFSYERYLAVGQGDIASVTDVMYGVRGTPVGTLSGTVLWASTLEPATTAHVYVFADPDPKRDFESVAELADENLAMRGDVGLLNAIDADPGLDSDLDGRFAAKLEPGTYLVAARAEDGSIASKPDRVRVRRNQETIVNLSLPIPGTVEYRVSDEGGKPVPCKVALVSLDKNDKALAGDGRRLVYLGDGRLGNGRRALDFSASGEGSIDAEPGRYGIVVSRGMEYSVFRDVVEIRSGQLTTVDATIVREVDTKGWMSADMHLHSRPSFDSGMAVARRVTTAAAEGVELAVSTDHDVETDYSPAVRELFLDTFVKSAIGAEITTLEQGHFIGFPLQYDELIVPTHGAHDWVCQPGGEILDGIRRIGDNTTPFTIVAHPRDGFFGYIDQLGVDAYTMNRRPTLLEAQNQVFRTASCEFDAMEIISAKRNDLIRTPTVREIAFYNRCLRRINDASDEAELAVACPELSPEGPLKTCTGSERIEACKTRNRTALANIMTRQILERTPVEQQLEWNFPGTAVDSQALCDLEFLPDDIPAELLDLPCNYRAGQVDDYFRYLERGFTPTQIGSSDAHGDGKEPGFPRTYFRSETDSPTQLKVLDAVKSLRGGHAFATYGPFVSGSIGEASFGDVVKAGAGSEVELNLDVQTASWFGVDRVEIYLNGEMIRLLSPDKPVEAILDVSGKVTFNVPDRDSWVVVIAMGLKESNRIDSVSLDVPFGEVQLSQLASDAFSRIPVVSDFFKAPPTIPDWGHQLPYAITNPIYIDTDGNGRYDAPLPLPEFCSRKCTPGGDPAQCPEGQVCLDEEQECGFVIINQCSRRPAAQMDH